MATATEPAPPTTLSKAEREFFKRMEKKYELKLALYIQRKDWHQVEALTLWYGMFLTEFAMPSITESVQRPILSIGPGWSHVSVIPQYFMSLA